MLLQVRRTRLLSLKQCSLKKLTLFLFLNTQVFVWAQRLNTLWYPSVQDNYSAERLAADSQAGTSESLQ